MKKILVLVKDYPNVDGGIALMYVHTRNKYYIKHDIEVTVLNFSTKIDYEIDGIKVISLDSYKKNKHCYDMIILHAANIRNHYRFLRKYDNRFKHMIFFFHGHEILMLNESYPEPYDYMKKNNKFKILFQNIYDKFKLVVWHKYFIKVADKTDFVFVSNWLFEKFQTYVKLSKEDLLGHVHIINNSIGSIFEKNIYNYTSNKKFDFITIRNNMDKSTYCIDLVDRLAKEYPQYRFLIIGRGEYYKVHSVPKNVTWVNRFLCHEEIIKYIDQSKNGLLLTRQDTQGVMTCEFAEYGIPVITSDIKICREIFGDLNNVNFINNDSLIDGFENVYKKLQAGIPYKKQGKFSYKNTVQLEEKLIKSIYKRKAYNNEYECMKNTR